MPCLYRSFKNGSRKFQEPQRFFIEPKMVLYPIFSYVFHIWLFLVLLGKFEGSPERSPERTTLELFFS